MTEELKQEVASAPGMVQISKEEWDKVQAQLKMLYEVADKGRVYNYESSKAEKKPLKVKLSKYKGGIIVGWRTLKDEYVFHPTTGKQVGEIQQYEVLIDTDGKIEPTILDGYPSFTEARYVDRIECEIKGKKENYDGKITYDIQLPEGRVISLDSRFIN